MENIEEMDLEVLDRELKPFSYKWTKGDNTGQICEYDNLFKDPTSGIIWVNFKGGSRINYFLLDEYMLRLDSDLLSNSTPTMTEVSPVRNIRISEPNNKKMGSLEDNPIIALLQKQKPNWVDVGINLKLNLPTKSLYNVLTTSFEDAEEKIIEFVVSDLDVELIKESLRINIKDIYKANGNTRKSGTEGNSKDKE